MFEFAKKLLKKTKWDPSKSLVLKDGQSGLLLSAFVGVIEDSLLWKNNWLSLSFLSFVNVLFFACAHLEVHFSALVFTLLIVYFCIDAIETWLKYKHRTNFLKQLAAQDDPRLYRNITKAKTWFGWQWTNFMCLREINHTKAFLLANIVLSVIFIIGKCISGYLLTYLLVMSSFTYIFWAPPIYNLARKIQQHAESDNDIDNLIPVVTDSDLKELSFEPEPMDGGEDKQNLDYWKPDELPIGGDVSDSSENSNSMITNLSMEKLQRVERDADTSDSSDDDYIPLIEKKEQLHSTLEVIETSSTWSNSAYNALRSLSGVVTGIYSTTTPHETKQRKRVMSSTESSDGFEIIDKHDFLKDPNNYA